MECRTQFILPDKLYRKRLARRVLLFNPDAQGAPFLVDEDVSEILDACSNGVSFQKVLSLAPPSLSPDEKTIFIDFLRDHHIIQLKRRDGVPETHRKSSEGAKVEVWLHITNSCNLQCPYCFVQKSPGTLSKLKIRQFVDALLSGCEKKGYKKIVIKFSGGEPLLEPQIIEYVVKTFEKRKIDQFDLRYSVISNGTLIDERKIELFKKHKILVSISIDGYGKCHDRTRKDMRGNGSFDTIEKNIALLRKNDIHPFILSTISEKTVDHLPRLIRWVLDGNFKTRVNFVKYMDYSPSDYERYCRKIVVSMRKSISEIKKHLNGPDFAISWSLANLSFTNPTYRQPCPIAQRHLVVNHWGELTLCPSLLNSAIGTVSDEIFEQYEKFEPLYDMKKPISKDCQACQWLHVCGSGCPVLNEHVMGHPNQRSPFCDAYRELIPMYIDLYGWGLEKLDFNSNDHAIQKSDQ